MTEYNSIGIMRESALDSTIHWYEGINDWLKAFGLIVGSLLASIADWVLGSITVTILFSATSVFIPSWTLGIIWSGASWGIQLLMWQLVLSGAIGHFFSGNKKAQRWTYGGLFILIILMKLADDGVDMTSVYWLAQNNPFINILPPAIYKAMVICIGTVSWILVGFSEAFVSLSLVFLRRGKGAFQTGRRADGSQSQFRPASMRNAYQSAPSTIPRAAVKKAPEPTYHPYLGMSTDPKQEAQG